MAKALQLYNTFTRQLKRVYLNEKLVTSIGGHGNENFTNVNRNQMLTGSFYICGPTVYSHCHLGHALTYIRADLFRRFMKNYFNVHLTTVMNITDIDDKILNICKKEFGSSVRYPSDPKLHPFRQISDRYQKSFLDDLRTIRVQPADVYVKISENINLIIKFIQRLEKNKQAYIRPTGDIVFDVDTVKNYQGRIDKRSNDVIPCDNVPEYNDNSHAKKDSRDFVLWKCAKVDEPVWNYRTIEGKIVPGRPGWHVQCSAISTAFFGNHLDFHYGGKDLIFPHHYNEEACNCAFHDLDTSSSLHVWCKNWLHSSHLTIKRNGKKCDDNEPVTGLKMSKSLGNVIQIKNFIDRSSVNALRLLCVIGHYRSDLEFTNDLLEKVKILDHKINALYNFLADAINQLKTGSELEISDSIDINRDLERMVLKTQDDIVKGVCDDMDLKSGLDSILVLSKFLYNNGTSKFKQKDIIACWSFLRDWCQCCGLEYGGFSTQSPNNLDCNINQEPLYDLIRNFRQQVRALALDEIKLNNTQPLSKKILEECDKLRSHLDRLGYVERDKPTDKDVR